MAQKDFIVITITNFTHHILTCTEAILQIQSESDLKFNLIEKNIINVQHKDTID